MSAEITIYAKGTGTGVNIWRPGKREPHEYTPTASSLRRIFAAIQKYRSYYDDCPPHWTRYVLIFDPVRRNHFARLNGHIKTPGTKWEIDAALYQEFLGMLPPLAHRHDGFYMREFCQGKLTTRYSRRAGRYFCEFAIYPPPKEGER